MIQVRDLTKQFGPVTAVRCLSFDAPDGTITGLLGSNGAGKTTALRMIAGILTPDGGSVRVDDTTLEANGVGVQKRIGALLDHAGFYPRLTARENLAYFGALRGIPAPALAERVDQVLSTLGLTAIADRRTAGFSQGERMKVALGRAMIHAPTHVLLDEPTNGLDVPTVRSLRLLLRQLRDRGTCIVFSSHVLGEVEELCDRAVVIAKGSVTAEGTLDQVRCRTSSHTLEDAFIKLTNTPNGAPC